MKRIKINYPNPLLIFFLGFFLLFTVRCNDDEENLPVMKQRGDILSTSYIKSYTAASIRTYLTTINLDINVDIVYDVDAYRIVYLTPDINGNLIQASGAVMIPNASESLPAISFHHGTQTKRELVASVDPTSIAEGFAGLVASSAGFVVFLPDYLGLGASNILHPYLHADLSAGPVIDMLTAGNVFCTHKNILLNGDLYIGGYSEGGYVTLAAQEQIEGLGSFPFNIVASAPQAGPYDLYSTVDHFIDIDEYPEPAFMAFLLTAYNDIYVWHRLQEIFKQPYAAMMPGLFDGTNTVDEISAQLPTKISELVQEDFLTGFKNGTEVDFINALKENTPLNWAPKSFTRFYHSNADSIVPYQNALTAVENLTASGGTSVELVTIDGLSHSEASVPAVTQMIEWFDSLRLSK